MKDGWEVEDTDNENGAKFSYPYPFAQSNIEPGLSLVHKIVAESGETPLIGVDSRETDIPGHFINWFCVTAEFPISHTLILVLNKIPQDIAHSSQK